MESKVKLLEDSHAEVVVDVEEEAWKAAQDKAFKKLAGNVSIPGFRKGKAPVNMVKGKIDPVKVMDEAINDILPVVYKDVLAKENLKPFAQPKVEVTKLSDKELQIKFVIALQPKVTLGNYKGLKIGKETVEVTDADVDAAIDALRAKNATMVVKEGAAEKGDAVIIDFVGSVDGKEFDGGKAENYELELGSGTFIPGFEDQLIGTKAGEKKNVNVKFPENYVPELKGKDAVFACTIHEVKEKKLPEINEEFIADLNEGVKTIEELKAKKKEELTSKKTAAAKSNYLSKVIDAIVADSKIVIPDEIIENQAASHVNDMEKRMEQSGLTLEQYLQITGQTPEDFNAKLKEDSKKEISGFLVLEEVAAAEKIAITDEELEFEISKIADQYKMKVEDAKKAISDKIDEFRHNIKMNRVEDLLYKNND